MPGPNENRRAWFFYTYGLVCFFGAGTGPNRTVFINWAWPLPNLLHFISFHFRDHERRTANSNISDVSIVSTHVNRIKYRPKLAWCKLSFVFNRDTATNSLSHESNFISRVVSRQQIIVFRMIVPDLIGLVFNSKLRALYCQRKANEMIWLRSIATVIMINNLIYF